MHCNRKILGGGVFFFASYKSQLTVQDRETAVKCIARNTNLKCDEVGIYVSIMNYLFNKSAAILKKI